MDTQITALYAALLALLYVFLSARVIAARVKHRVDLGHKNNKDMLVAIRVHGNFAEYIPFALILMFLLERSGASSYLLHLLGSLLFVGRLIYSYAIFAKRGGPSIYRAISVLSTFLVFIIAAVVLLKLMII